jgi:hypothetical protein
MSDEAAENVAAALAAEARRHRDEINAGRVSRLLVEARIGQDGEIRTRPARLRTRNLQPESD